jgi:hypothetical protein
MARVFISYKRNHPPTNRLMEAAQARLSAAGHTLFIDSKVEPGARWDSVLYRELLDCDAALVFVSAEAMASDWCVREHHVLHARASVDRVKLISVCVGLDRAHLGVLSTWQSLDGQEDTWLEQVVNSLPGPSTSRDPGDDYLALHRAWIRWCWEGQAALPGESFTLKDVYQGTGARVSTWGDLQNNAKFDPFTPEREQRPALDSVRNLVLDASFRDVVVVQGVPGSGKSAFCIRLCQDLSEHGLEPLLIRFRDLSLAGATSVEQVLSEAIRFGPEDEPVPTPAAGLLNRERLQRPAPHHRIAKTVVILDGWDEVTLGGATYEAQLQTWLPRFREYFLRPNGLPVKLVVTGRPSPVLRNNDFLTADSRVVTLHPLTPSGFRAIGDALLTRTHWGLQPEIIAALSKLAADTDKATAQLVALPLLTLLAYRTAASWKGDLAGLLDVPSRLYQALIDQTVGHSGKATSDAPRSMHHGGASLRRLLRRTAAVVTSAGSERLSFAELQRRLANDDALGDWAQDKRTLEQLVVNYYFKAGQKGFGCEFVHKSFREYLFAEEIVATLEDTAGAREGSYPAAGTEHRQDFSTNTPQHLASRTLATLLGPQWMTTEVRSHLFWLIDFAITRHPKRWVWIRDLLADVYQWWAEGIPLRPVTGGGDADSWKPPILFDVMKHTFPRDRDWDPPRIVTYDAHFGDALLQIAAYVHAKMAGEPHHSSTRPYQVEIGGRCLLRPGGKAPKDGKAYMSEIISRIGTGAQRPLGRRASGMWLGPVCLEGENLTGEVFTGAFLQGARLEGSELKGVIFDHADLRDAAINRSQLMIMFQTHFEIIMSDLSTLSEQVEIQVASWRQARLPDHLKGLEYGGTTGQNGEVLPPLGVWTRIGDGPFKGQNGSGQQERLFCYK